MSVSNCCFLTCIRISQEAVQVVWYSHLFLNFPQFIVIHTVKGFGIVNKAEIDVFLELSCFFHDPLDVGNLIYGSSAFSKSNLTSISSQFTYCWSLIWRILSIILLVCEMSAIVQCNGDTQHQKNHGICCYMKLFGMDQICSWMFWIELQILRTFWHGPKVLQKFWTEPNVCWERWGLLQCCPWGGFKVQVERLILVRSMHSSEK